VEIIADARFGLEVAVLFEPGVDAERRLDLVRSVIGHHEEVLQLLHLQQLTDALVDALPRPFYHIHVPVEVLEHVQVEHRHVDEFVLTALKLILQYVEPHIDQVIDFGDTLVARIVARQ
jgi:hypothetical protein